MEFTGVRNTQVPGIWHRVAGLVQRAIDVEQEYTLEEIYYSLTAGMHQLWVAGDAEKIEAILITKLMNSICYVELCAGKGMACTKYLKIVEEWARQAGCNKIVVMGRRGWERALKKKNYKFKNIVLAKEL